MAASSTSNYHVCEHGALWRGWADAYARLGLRCSPMRRVPTSHVQIRIVLNVCRLTKHNIETLLQKAFYSYSCDMYINIKI